MKKLVWLNFLSLILSPGLAAEPLTPERFSFFATVETPASVNPVQIVLPREVMTQNDDAFSNLRLFDVAGRETAYVIYPEQQIPGDLKAFTFKIIGFNTNPDGTQGQIILERPGRLDHPQGQLELQLFTPHRDFQKKIVISTSADKTNWKVVATDSWFDFSSQVDFRRNTLERPLPNARYLRVQFSDEKAAATETSNLHLKYKDLEFTAQPTGLAQPFKIERVEGIYRTGEIQQRTYEQIQWDHLPSSLDKEGNSLVPLGELNLAGVELRLVVANPYYYRRVWLQGAHEDKPELYSTLAEGTVYRIPGAASFDNVISGPFPRARFLRLKILNGNNPPLQISSAQLAWNRHHLYFVPTQPGPYTLRWGGPPLPPPHYELRSLLPAEPQALAQFFTVAIGAPQPNPNFIGPAPVPQPHDTPPWLLRGLIALLVLGLAAWTYTLLRKLQNPAA